ncbi:MAG: alanine racemase, partial [Nocardioides sp.]
MSARAGDQPGGGEFAQGVIEVDLGAVTHNVAALTRFVGAASVMAIVKADAYGHGMTGCAAAARAGGATWLGVATAR